MSAKDALTTPRPLPNRVAPAVAGTAAALLALPVFLLVGAPVRGWLLGIALWAVGQSVGAALARLPLGAVHAKASGVVGFGMMVRAGAIMAVLIAIATVAPSLALAAALVYALGYTVELALALTLYFSGDALA
ncbi:MAG TPA: hypothetical protein VNT58_05500 [Gaiellaceae bacterium]|nr:hypothetical protein [Gaiellaceae bacterium]